MERYICIHGHFYQPPRENPWLESIELQDSAYPYHDWNERITAECYAPNSAARILDGEGRIEKIVSNYAKMSFNFGPTLLSWLESNTPEVYNSIRAADQQSQQNYSGHGSALAQAYNHMIMPLANSRDKETQVVWGIQDFEHRFGRRPKGMWLPETAVDLETLGVLARHGIKFTILSPYQARRMRAVGSRSWREVSGGRIDPSTAYRLRLKGGRSINLFFYDGPISKAIAFEGLLAKGEDLANRLTGAFSDSRTWPQLVHIATDGETYGHHHRYGDMGLAYTMDYIQKNNLARFTNYGEYLEKHPPTHEAQILENTSWSCAHGVERWRSNCGCNSGGRAGWKQEWRGPLREALDWLRDTIAPSYVQTGSELLKDPWAARNDYIQVILDRSPENVCEFLRSHAAHELNDEEQMRALKLLELQRHAMLMYTSCGWFFDELSGIETVQVIHYAARAVQLSQQLFGNHIEAQFLERLERAKSNISEHKDGRVVYEKFVRPAMVDLPKVGAHYAVSSLFHEYQDETKTYCYTVSSQDHRIMTAGKAKLSIGRAKVTSDITRESATVAFGVVHLGEQNIAGGVRTFHEQEAESYAKASKEITEIFERGDLSEILRVIDKTFGTGVYTLKLLFRDEQRKILHQILESVLNDFVSSYRQLFQNHATLMRFMNSVGVPIPRHFAVAAEFALNADLRSAIEQERLDLAHIQALLDETAKAGAHLDEATIEFALRRKIEALNAEFRAHPDDLATVQLLDAAVGLARKMPFEVNLWTAQNTFYNVLQSLYPKLSAEAASANENARAWVEQFRELGERLRVRVP